MKLQKGRTAGTNGEVMEKTFRLIKIALPLAIVVLCLFAQTLNHYCGIFREFQAALLSADWMLLVCLSLWCGTLFFLTFRRKDWPLIGLLLIGLALYSTGNAGSLCVMDAAILLGGVTLGKGAQFLLKRGKLKAESENTLNAECGVQSAENMPELRTPNSERRIFLVSLVAVLAYSAWWHLDMSDNYYIRLRWTGLWNNPNIYGMLMGEGVVLAIGLLATNLKSETGNRKWENRNLPSPSYDVTRAGNFFLRLMRFFAAIKSAILLGAAGMMAVGLVMSYSRGAMLATSVGLLYLAWCYGKLKWRYVALGAGLVALGALCLWGRTPDNAPWYLKRLDFSRPSAQHRVSAWRGALHIMRDHPLGVGWNQAISTYDKNYSPPEGGAQALTMNSYLMLGTELGLPGLLCFVAYVGLALGAPASCRRVKSKAEPAGRMPALPAVCDEASQLRCACRAGAIVLLVAFWFDGGLFDLPTAVMFWVLLELGAMRGGRAEDGRSRIEDGKGQSEINQSLVTSAATEKS